MYRTIIRTQQTVSKSFSDSFHFHCTPSISSPKKQYRKENSFDINYLQGYLHLFRNPQIQVNLIKTEVLLIIGLSKVQHQKLTQYLQNRAQQIQVLDNIYEPRKMPSQNNSQPRGFLIGVIVVFKNLSICQEAHQFIEENFQALVLYIQDVIIMHGWNHNKLQRNPAQQQLQSLKNVLDGKFQYRENRQLSDFVSQEPLQEKQTNKNTQQKQKFSHNWVQLPHCIYCLQSLQYSVIGVKVDKKLTQKLKLSSNQQCKACQAIERSKKDHIECGSCKQIQDNWVCLVCGQIGCGRYKNADAYKHFTKSGHILSMDLQTRSIWNYKLDCFSHRMVSNGQINIKFPQCEEDVTETALQGAFWDYCSIVSEQLHRQRSFYEGTIEKYKKRYQDQNSQLDQVIEQLNSLRMQKAQRLKRESKKKKKIEKKVSEIRQKCIQEREMNKNYQEVLSQKQQQLVNDNDIIKKKRQILAVQQQIQQVLLELTQN